MFPYPSGDLHMGHVRVYALSDTIARFRRMNGGQVIHPIGWDAFGLPAENAANQRGVDPAAWTKQNIASMRKQLQRLGIGFDWDRELATCDPEYYRWTQHLFVRLLRAGLAERRRSEVNWDPVDGTVLANEQVAADGTSWRSGAVVEKRLLWQWYIKLTEYADALVDDLQLLDPKRSEGRFGGQWPSHVLRQQEQWIGRSGGASVRFQPSDPALPTLEVFTTRLDTLPGVSYLAVAADHPAALLAAARDPAVEAGLARLRQEAAGAEPGAEPSSAGVSLGFTARVPGGSGEVPVYAAAYVLSGYGSGAVMGVPAHDERDFRFARQHHLPVEQVVWPAPAAAGEGPVEPELPFTDKGVVRGQDGNWLSSDAAAAAMLDTAAACQEPWAAPARNYRVHDWLVSRQRYWGAPVPVVHCDSCGPVPVPESQLPVTLPDRSELLIESPSSDLGRERTGSPLESAPAAWLHTECPECGGHAVRDTDTLDTFVDSSWYFHRFPDSQNKDAMFDGEGAARASPVDVYVGGVEHAILHLLYARFVHKFLGVDGGRLPDPRTGAAEWDAAGAAWPQEPFRRLLAQGMVLGRAYRVRATGKYVSEAEAANMEAEAVEVVWEKMSKSKGNGVSPDAMVERHGADVTRLGMLFAAPPDKEVEWEEAQLSGQRRWLERLAGMADRVSAAQDARPDCDWDGPSSGLLPADRELRSATHRCLAAVDEVMRGSGDYAFNVAIAQLMQLSNAVSDHLGRCSEKEPAGQQQQQQQASSLAACLALRCIALQMAPLAPHFAAELWERCGPGEVPSTAWSGAYDPATTVHQQVWPSYNAEWAAEEALPPLVVQLKGRKVAELTIEDPAVLEDAALAEDLVRVDPGVAAALQQEGIGWEGVARVVVVLRGRSPIVNIALPKQKKDKGKKAKKGLGRPGSGDRPQDA